MVGLNLVRIPRVSSGLIPPLHPAGVAARERQLSPLLAGQLGGSFYHRTGGCGGDLPRDPTVGKIRESLVNFTSGRPALGWSLPTDRSRPPTPRPNCPTLWRLVPLRSLAGGGAAGAAAAKSMRHRELRESLSSSSSPAVLGARSASRSPNPLQHTRFHRRDLAGSDGESGDVSSLLDLLPGSKFPSALVSSGKRSLTTSPSSCWSYSQGIRVVTWEYVHRPWSGVRGAHLAAGRSTAGHGCPP